MCTKCSVVDEPYTRHLQGCWTECPWRELIEAAEQFVVATSWVKVDFEAKGRLLNSIRRVKGIGVPHQ